MRRVTEEGRALHSTAAREPKRAGVRVRALGYFMEVPDYQRSHLKNNQQSFRLLSYSFIFLDLQEKTMSRSQWLKIAKTYYLFVLHIHRGSAARGAADGGGRGPVSFCLHSGAQVSNGAALAAVGSGTQHGGKISLPPTGSSFSYAHIPLAKANPTGKACGDHRVRGRRKPSTQEDGLTATISHR